MSSKLREFATKCGPPGRAAITLAQEWEFRPWVIDVYGGVHATMREDVHGLSAFIAEGRAGRRVSDAVDAATVASTANSIMTGFSYELQRQLFSFFERRLHNAAS